MLTKTHYTSLTADVDVSLLRLPLFLFLSISGSLFVYTIAKWLSPKKVLQYIGRESIVIYLFHMYFLLKVLPILAPICNSPMMQSSWAGVVAGILLIMTTHLFCTIMNIILNTRYLKFILGKF